MDKAQYRKLMDWMKNDCHLQNWWEEEFAKSDAEIDSALRNKMFVRIKEETVGKSRSARVIRMNILRWAARLPRFLHLLLDRHVANTRNAFRCEGR